MALRNRKQDTNEKVLDVDAAMTGSLTFKDPVNLRINGKFDGKLDLKGTLTIGRTAEVSSSIHGENVVIAGKVNGSIVATESISLLSTAELRGDIQTPKLSIAEGAIFEGRSQMLADYFDIEQLSRYLEVDRDSVMEWADSGKMPGFKEGKEWRFDRKKIDEWLVNEKIK